MRRPSRICAILASLILVLALGALSRFPFGESETTTGVLRLSWRFRGERIEECRRPTPEELEALPIHMRRTEICEGRVEPAPLRVAIDGRVIEETLIDGAGARHDRPIYVLRELPLAAGEYRVEIDFADLALDTIIAVHPGQYELITIEPVRRELVLISRGERER